ncbi:MAG TPA: acyltransferase [Methylophilaceae bacterium]|nr:acyltransferase [Methylophilaceae bacterium]
MSSGRLTADALFLGISLSSPNPAHVVGIDAVRFLAAVLVMFFHYGFWVGFKTTTSAHQISQGMVSYPELFAWTKFGWIGVQIFFVISGFVIAYSAERATAYKFLVARVVRLYPAAIICATISLAAAILVSYTSYSELIIAYIKSVTLWPQGPWIDDSYWTLAIELFFYALVFMLISFDKFHLIARVAIAIGLISVGFNIVALLGQSPAISFVPQILFKIQDSRIADLLLLNHGMFFALGIFLWLQLLKKPAKQYVSWCCVFTIAGLTQIAATVGSFDAKGANMPLLLPMLIWLVALGVIILSVLTNRVFSTAPAWVSMTLRRMGLMTYPLYLIHQNVGLALIGQLIKVGMQPYLALGLGVAFAISISWAISVYLEPPLQKAMKTFLLNIQGKAMAKVA